MGGRHINICCNDKKVYVGSTQGPFKKQDITIIEVVLHTKTYRHRISLSNYEWEIKMNHGIDPIKWEIVKNVVYVRLVIYIVNYVWRKN